MKRAVILHGTDGKPCHHWMPWLKAKLEEQGYEVWVPELPENHTPNARIYNDFLFGLADQRCPKIRLGVMVGAWAGGMPVGNFEVGQFDKLFPENGFDFEKIKDNADHLAFLHSDDDPHCPLEQAQYLAGELDAPVTVLHGAGHISKGFKEVPELWGIIEQAL